MMSNLTKMVEELCLHFDLCFWFIPSRTAVLTYPAQCDAMP